MTKTPLFWLERIWCCIPFWLVFTLQDRTSGDLDLVWLKVLWKGYRGYRAAISGKTLVIGKNEVKHWVHGRLSGSQVLYFKDSHRTWPWPSCGCLWRSTHANQVGGSMKKALVLGEWVLEKRRKFRYSGYNAYGVVSPFGCYSRCSIELRVTLT